MTHETAFCVDGFDLWRIYCTTLEPRKRRKRRLIVSNTKCRQLKKLTCKGTLRQVFICQRPITSYPPPPYTLYTCMQYTYSHREGGRGRVEPERRLEGQQFTLPQESPLKGKFFRCQHFASVSIQLTSLCPEHRAVCWRGVWLGRVMSGTLSCPRAGVCV